MTSASRPVSPLAPSVSHSNPASTHIRESKVDNESTVGTRALLPMEVESVDGAEKRKSSGSSSAWRLAALQRHISNGWLWECVSGLFAIGALAAMVAVLATAQNKSLTTWREQHLHISINAVIAVLSTLLKGSSMLIVTEVLGQSKWQWFESSRTLNDFDRLDSASRGPLGSAKMLHWIHGPKIALLGAFLTVIALAVDPFTQNIVAAVSCSTLDTNRTAIMPTADVYGKFSNSQVSDDPSEWKLWGRPWYSITAPMQAAIYSGLFSATNVINGSTIHAVCPGFNCTYPRYTTIGVCHKCVDVSSSIVTSCNQETSSNQSNGTQPACTWSLPNGQFLKSYTAEELLFRPEKPIQNFAVVNSSIITVGLGNIPGTFTNVSILANVSSDTGCTIDTPNDCNALPVGYVRTPFNTIAAECALFACARTYTATVVDGKVIETEVKRTVSDREDWMTDELSDGPQPRNVIIDPKEDCIRNASRVYDIGEGPCTYVASRMFTASAARFAWRFWNGTVSGRIFSEGVATSGVVDILYNRGITNFTYIDEILGSIANSMTAAMRLTGNALADQPASSLSESPEGWGGQGQVTGQVYFQDSCISVRWGWIALPAAVAWGSLLLLVFSVFSTRGKRTAAWKSSALPVLFHGLAADTDRHGQGHGHAPGQLATISEMEMEAKRVRVTLTENQRGGLGLEKTL